MECKYCGGSYRLRELRCPYCGAENLAGRMLLMRRTEAIRQMEAEQKAAKKRYVPYVASKLVSRLILLFLLSIIILILIYTNHVPWIRRDANGKIFEPGAVKLYEAGDFYGLHEYMSAKDLYQEMPEYFSQSALLAYDYNEFITHRLNYLADDASQWDPTYVALVMRGAMDIYVHRVGVYSDKFPENEAQYDMYRKYILAFWKGTMLCTDEEVEWLADEESWGHSAELNDLCVKLKERRIAADAGKDD